MGEIRVARGPGEMSPETQAISDAAKERGIAGAERIKANARQRSAVRTNAIDLFAGPGGWDVALNRVVGIDPPGPLSLCGIEVDEAACRTRRCANLSTVQADVSVLDPKRLPCNCDHTADEIDAACSPWHRYGCPQGMEGVDLLIASPPCPTFSSAGKGDGIADLSLVYQLADAIALDPTLDVHTAMPDEFWRDTRSRLVVEPLRWALQLEPRFLAWEQVPPVLPFWEYCAEILRRKGWNVWTGKVEAERYGRVASCPLHDQRPAPDAGSQFALTDLASADPALEPAGSAPGVPPESMYAAARDFASVAAGGSNTSKPRCPAGSAESLPTPSPMSARTVETAAWGGWIQSAENAERRSRHAANLASVENAETAPDTGLTQTGALSDAWTVASLARAALDAASDATWRGHVNCLLSLALPELRIPRGRAAAMWTSAATSGSAWTASTGESITWSPSSFWAALCALARSYTMSTKTRPTTIEATFGSSPATRITCTSTIQERSSTDCSLCDDIAVPQTRERAILMADREAPVHPPRPTHQRYVKGEPQRHEVTLEGEVLPWVSMAEALGWGMSERPSVTVASGGKRYGAKPLGGGSGSQRSIDAERDRGAWIEGPEPAPAPTVSGGGTGAGGGVEVFAGSDARERARRAAVKLVNGNQDNATEREAEEPASTIAFGHNSARVEWVMEKKEDRPERKAQGAGNSLRSSSEPAATIDSRADLSKWTTERPSTAVCGDPRISPPGYRGRADEYDAEGNYTGERSMDNAIRVTLEEAAILQSFPPDYPFQGSKSQRFLQVGNAVPPLLAEAILSALLAPVLTESVLVPDQQEPAA